MVEYFMLSKMMSALPRIAPDVRIFQIGSLMPIVLQKSENAG